MINVDKVELNLAGVREVMSSPIIEEIIRTNIELVADAAEADAINSGYEKARFDAVVDKHKHGIPSGHVFPNDVAAKAHNETGCLLSAFNLILGGD